MGLDESDHDPPVGLDVRLVEEDRPAVGRRAHRRERRGILGRAGIGRLTLEVTGEALLAELLAPAADLADVLGRELLDDHVGLDAVGLDAPAARGVVARDGELEGAAVGELDDVLDAAFAERACADYDRAVLATLEQQLRKGIESGKINGAAQEREQAEFQGALKAGKTPPLHPFVFTTDYSPGDISALLESGGVELLEVKTLVALRELESVIRWGLSDLERYQKLSDLLVVPNLGREISFFYDPNTKQLRPPFEFYAQALAAQVKFAHDVDRVKIGLLKQIERERKK